MQKPKHEARPDVLAEAMAILDRAFPRRGPTVDTVVTIPLGMAEFAAWLMIKSGMKRDGDVGPVGRPIEVLGPDGSPGRDWDEFASFARLTVTGFLAEVEAEIREGTHHVLDPAPPI